VGEPPEKNPDFAADYQHFRVGRCPLAGRLRIWRIRLSASEARAADGAIVNARWYCPEGLEEFARRA